MGTVTPASASISTSDGINYKLIDSISDSVIIEKNNVIFDGSGILFKAQE